MPWPATFGPDVIIYGAGDSLGGAVGRAMAATGARVFLTHHRLASAAQVAEDIRASGGHAQAAEVDALDLTAVRAASWRGKGAE
jgi:3-oxoacyl-[acyl-carrier protein] reductase